MTAVEYIKEKLLCDEYWYDNMTFEQIFEQAKEMEKEQIINAWDDGKKIGASKCKGPVCQMKTGLGYYHKTFKSE